MTQENLIIFDVDGTLVDSQHMICSAMRHAYELSSIAAPMDKDVRACIGMSLAHIFPKLSPNLTERHYQALDASYRIAFKMLYQKQGYNNGLPFFEGMRELLDELFAREGIALALATGKSRQGALRFINEYDLNDYFSCVQTADFHPSKPDPSMVLTCLNETGIPAEKTVMIGDTSFDIDMGRAAGVKTIAVDWGYHDAASLNADFHVKKPSALLSAIFNLLGRAQ